MDSFMKPIIALIDLIMMQEGKKLFVISKSMLYGEFKITMGSSTNQVKTVRIIDAPIK